MIAPRTASNFAIALLLVASSAVGQTTTYQPFRTWTDPQKAAYIKWDISRQVRSMAPEARPTLPGLQLKDVELLKDGLLRKHPRLLKNSPRAAGELIVRRYASNPKQLRGIMGEALFLERNPEWGYVKKPNAPQHDVYRWIPGRQTPMTGQVKVLSGGNSEYARAMRKDWRSQRFFVPDDHVESLRAFWERRAVRLQARGDHGGYSEACRQRSRVSPAGFTMQQAGARTSNAAKGCLVEKYSAYTSLGASLALAVGPTMWDWARGSLPANQTLYRTTRALSLLGVGVGTDLSLALIRQGALRGSLRGNAITGTAIVITETTWLLYENSWSQALGTPEFYESLAGSVTGLAFAMIAGGATVAWVPGPGWVIGGTAILTGAVAETAGYVGGRAATQVIYEILAPEKLQQRQNDRLAEVGNTIARRIAELKTIN